jgi:hypothetical protein
MATLPAQFAAGVGARVQLAPGGPAARRLVRGRADAAGRARNLGAAARAYGRGLGRVPVLGPDRRNG